MCPNLPGTYLKHLSLWLGRARKTFIAFEIQHLYGVIAGFNMNLSSVWSKNRALKWNNIILKSLSFDHQCKLRRIAFLTSPCGQFLEELLSYAVFRELPHRGRESSWAYQIFKTDWKLEISALSLSVGRKVYEIVHKDIPKIFQRSEIDNRLDIGISRTHCDDVRSSLSQQTLSDNIWTYGQSGKFDDKPAQWLRLY